ncbi:MAG: hypothetical protein CVU39_09020 [Chloroflexi bacterium HGW-Chloroflexi-10]|nr:MAG: hypothetical protein CVU39_09020 [Chloroflexi bacterium HGW-Chloroflexi-10]
MIKIKLFLKNLLLTCLVITLLSGFFPWGTVQAAPTLTNVASMNAARTHHTATLLANGKVLVTGGLYDLIGGGYALSSAEIYDPLTNQWAEVASMSTPRADHTATLLTDGRVLVAGGRLNSINFESSAEIYDPILNTWTSTENMNTSRGFHTATLLTNGSVLVVGGAENFSLNGKLHSVELYNPHTNTWTNVDFMNAFRSFHTATLLSNGKVLVAGGNYSYEPISVEIYDPLADSWTAAASLSGTRYGHTATLLPNGKVLILGGNAAVAETYNPQDNTWENNAGCSGPDSTATLLPDGKVYFFYSNFLCIYNPNDSGSPTTYVPVETHLNHTATLLPTGQLLIVGGYDLNNILATARIFNDPTTTVWSAVAPLNTVRARHTATPLLNGKVLVAGGWTTANVYLAAAEIYDPQNNVWTNAGSLNTVRRYHTATLLTDGRVLVTGGLTTGDVPLSAVEIYDPAANSWTVAASMLTARRLHTATLLPNGKVIVIGGPDSSAEIYNPASDTWTAVSSMNSARIAHTATLLPNAKVLIVGGQNSGGYPGIAELYDPDTNSWANAAALTIPRIYHTTALLPNGKVLVAGGYSNGSILTAVEIYDPEFNTWADGSSLTAARNGHTMSVLPNGQVLAAGGYGPSGYVAVTELYNPALNTWTTVAPQNPIHSSTSATLLPNGKLLVVGGETLGGGFTASADVFDLGLGFNEAWRPMLDTIPSTSRLGAPLQFTGTGFRGHKNSEASGGGVNNSASNIPLVQIRRLDNDQVLWVQPADFNTTSYSSLPIKGLPAGPAAVTVFVNGIPGLSHIVVFERSSTTTTLTTNANPAEVGQNITFTAAVSSEIGEPTGTVIFKEGALTLGANSLTAGIATFNTAMLSAGSHTIIAEYSGDSDYYSSLSTAVAQKVCFQVFLPLLIR